MKKYILSAFLFCFALQVFAQKQTNIWYFGNQVGLDFNQNPPIPISNGNANSIEGSATVSDNNGKLLFYTNGLVINNRNHLLMKNGGNLAGNLSSTNNTIIVPHPGMDSAYYLFTVGAANELVQQFQYNIINMKGDGGLGEVDPAAANIVIADKTFEKLTAVKHCNNKDTWIIVHKWNTDELHAYLLTASGLNFTPVISHTGLVISGPELNELGVLKFSTNGKKMAAVHSMANDCIELMDFDNTTGLFSNPIIIRTSSSPVSMGAYGAEFSPDGRILYVSSTDYLSEKSNLYQFDISSNNAATINASIQTIHENIFYNAGALQMGPDFKIYMAMWNDSAVSVIEKPNVYGNGCNFSYNKINFGKSACVQYGLPMFIQNYFDTASIAYDFSRLTTDCLSKDVTFKINRLSGIDSVKWDFGDSFKSQALQPTHTYAAPGYYDVRLIVYKVDCSGLYDTITRKIWIADTDKFLGADTSSCKAFAMNIGIDEIFGVNYLWNTGFTGNKITTTGFGDYWLELEQNGCRIRDSIRITPASNPIVSLGPDTSICKNKPVILKTQSSNYDSYLWNTKDSTATLFVNQLGTYSVTVTKNGCEASDTIKVLPGDCGIYIPSAFSPNHDNLNETFGVVDYVALQYFSMKIYSKWGQLIFSSDDVSKKWDGTFKGKQMPNGSYLWMMHYTNMNGRKFYEQGTVMIVR